MGGIHCPAAASPLSTAPRLIPCAGSAHGDGDGLGTPSLLQQTHLIMHLGALMRPSNKQQRWEGPCCLPDSRGWVQDSTWEPLGTAAHVPLPPHLCPGSAYHVRGVFYGWNPTHGHLLPRPPSYLPVEDINHSGRSHSGWAVPGVAPPDWAAHKLTLPSPQTAGPTSACTTVTCW